MRWHVRVSVVCVCLCRRGVRGEDSCNVTEVPPEQRRELTGHGRYGPSEGGKINGPVTSTGCELSARHARLNTFRQHGAFVSATKDSRFVGVFFCCSFFCTGVQWHFFFFHHFHSHHQRFRPSCSTGSKSRQAAPGGSSLSAQVKAVNTSEPVRVCVCARDAVLRCSVWPCHSRYESSWGRQIIFAGGGVGCVQSARACGCRLTDGSEGGWRSHHQS